jgi:hypothetical protein
MFNRTWRDSKIKLMGWIWMVSATTTAWSWSGGTHREIASRALAGLSPLSRKTGRWYRRSLLRGAVAPDHPGEGWIPAQCHVLDGFEGPRGGIQGTVEKLETWLREHPTRDAEWWFQAGRLCHLIGDLCQPLHTGRSPGEKKVHSRYEKWTQGLPWPPTQRVAVGTASSLEALALRGHKRYNFLMETYGDMARRGELALSTREWLDLAVQETSARWRALGRPPKSIFGPPLGWMYSAGLWLFLLERRLRAEVRG